MKLSFDLGFGDLYQRAGLLRVDAAFLAFLEPAVRDRLVDARKTPPTGKPESELLIALAPHLEDFLARLFGIESEAQALAARHHELAPLYSVKRLFVQRRALHKISLDALKGFDPASFAFSSELQFAQDVTEWQKDETANAAELEAAAHYAAWATLTQEGKAKHRAGVLFKTPLKLDFMILKIMEPA